MFAYEGRAAGLRWGLWQSIGTISHLTASLRVELCASLALKRCRRDFQLLRPQRNVVINASATYIKLDICAFYLKRKEIMKHICV